jgi:PAS domain S-box-containing protein
MSANDLLTLGIQVLFILLSIITIIDFLRHRDAARRDIALTFSSLGVTIVIPLLTRMFGAQAGRLNTLATLTLVAQPYLMLRLIQHFHPVRPLIHRTALLGMIVSAGALLLYTTAPPPVATVAIIAYFVAINGYAMIACVRGALTTSGVVRQRLRLTAAGSGLLALVLVVAVISSLFPALRPVTTPATLVVAIASAVTYYLGFAPPPWLRRSWQLAELRNYLLQAADQTADEKAGIAQLCRSATQAVGGMAAGVVERDEAAKEWKLRDSTDSTLFSNVLQIGEPVLERVWKGRQPTFIHAADKASADDHRLIEAAGANTVLIVPMMVNERLWGLLLVFLRRHSLFIDEDLSLLELLTQQSAIILENYRLIDDLRAYSADLAQANALLTQEIAERKRVEERLAEERSLLRTFIDNIPDYVYVKDTQSRFLLNNLAHAQLLGAESPNEMVGKWDYDFFDKKLAAQYYADDQAVIRSGDPLVQREEPSARADGSTLWVSTTKVPLRDLHGNITGIVGVTRDITDARRAADEIKTLNQTLHQRARELEAANKELEAFSYSVSHDLRAPLRSIDGFSRILLEDYAAQLSPDALRYLNMVREDTLHMGQLIDDLLAFSRLSRQELNRQSVDPAQVVYQALADLRAEQDGRQIDLIVGDLPPCQADPALLKQVYVNLLSNALKYSRRRERAVVEIGSRREKDALVYYVKDNGVGFSMRYAHKLFGVFQRLHSADEYEGTGVGLAIVQRIVHRHGGRVWAEAEVDKGATFSFALEGGTNHG